MNTQKNNIIRSPERAKTYPQAVHHKSITEITQNDLDTLAEATKRNCEIVVLKKEDTKRRA